ncbi:MAG TPA: methyltransferase [Myxococcales bacterium]|nr:methyltransferase [Myxococcales bacterium]
MVRSIPPEGFALTRLVQLELALAAATFVALRLVVAPYGRHLRAGWGPTLPARLGWVLMESPSVLFFAWVYARGPHRGDPTPLVLLGLWELHYLQRTAVYPLRMRANGRRMPALIALLAIAFNLLNSWNNAGWISGAGALGAGWLHGWRFLTGAALFAAGFGLNLSSDGILFRLRAPGEQGYRIPRGGLYRWVSSPNYLGEMIEWCGWALAAWSPAGLAFALYTVANLAPRAVQNHRWYREAFPDYPKERRALIPFVV